jgi:purine-binding chemotaxis protein CheW
LPSVGEVAFEPPNGSKASSNGAIAVKSSTSLFAHLSTDEQQILRSRSESLRQAVDTQDTVGVPITVIRLAGEYFGLSLETVHEFTDIRKVTPVPCCPPHILGNMNLRGEIVTLVDISQAVNLLIDSSNFRRKAIVVRMDDVVAGIAVDEIVDVIHLDLTQISTVPVAIHSASDEYLQGVASYQDKMIGIINLSKILSSGVLVVNEDL